jgi:hypothetical protein
MKRIAAMTLVFALLVFLSALQNDATAQTLGKSSKTTLGQHGPIDSDGDGIPNGLDPDYTKPANGTGQKFGKMSGSQSGLGKGMGKGMGLRDGSCGTCVGTGTGVCDGTGPKGQGRGR